MSFRHYVQRVRRALDRGKRTQQSKKLTKRLLLESLEGRILLDVKALATDLDMRLGEVDNALKTISSINTLPVINKPLIGPDGLKEAQDVISGFRKQLKTTLETSEDGKVKDNLWRVLGRGLPDGLDVLGRWDGTDGVPATADEAVKVTFGPNAELDLKDKDVAIQMRLTKKLAVSTPLTLGLGLPGFPLDVKTSGSMAIGIGFDMNLNFGLHNGGFFFAHAYDKAPGPNQFTFKVDAALAKDASLEGRIGFIGFTAKDLPGAPTGFKAQVSMDVPSSGKLVSPTFSAAADADVNLKLTAHFSEKSPVKFPSLSTDFKMHWHFNKDDKADAAPASFGQAPTIHFDNVTMNLGSFLGDVAGPVVEKIKTFTQVLQPVVDVLKTRIPGLSDVFRTDVTLLDLAKAAQATKKLPPDVDLIITLTDTLAKIIDTVNSVTVNAKSVEIHYGKAGWDVGGDLRNLPKLADLGDFKVPNLTDPTKLFATGEPFTLQSVRDAIENSPLARPAKDALQAAMARLFPDKKENGIQLKSPLLDAPKDSILKFLLGQEADLVTFTAHLDLKDGITEDGSANLLGLTAGFEGKIFPYLHFQLGYDSRGLREFLKDPSDASHLLNGLYLGMEEGNKTKLDLTGYLHAFVKLNGPVYSIQVSGGLDGELHVLPKNPPSGSSKLRYQDIKDDPGCVIHTSGALKAGISVTVKIGVEAFGVFAGIKKTFDIASRTLLDLNTGCLPKPFVPPPSLKLASIGEDGAPADQLWLNIGPRRGLRGGTLATTKNEVYTVTHDSGKRSDASGETVIISAFGFEQKYVGVHRIFADAGDGDDTITIADGVLTNAELHHTAAGKAQFTYLGKGTGKLYAENADDATLIGGPGSNELYGGAGVNRLIGGKGSNLLAGGTGTKYYKKFDPKDDEYDDLLIGGQGPNELRAGAGREKLVAGPQMDTLIGGTGDNEYVAGAGTDTVRTGSGNNVVRWQVGNGDLTIDGTLGGSTLQMVGSDANEAFTVAQQEGGGVRIAAPSSRTVRGTRIRRLYIEGGNRTNTFTVNYLGNSGSPDLFNNGIQEVGINLGRLANPRGGKNTIVVNAAPVENPITVEKEKVKRFPYETQDSSKWAGVTKVTGLGHPLGHGDYLVRAANVQDNVVVNTGDGNDTVSVLGITGPTQINTGTGNDKVSVGTTANTLDDLLGPLTIKGKGNNVVLAINDQGTATPQTYNVTASTVARSGVDPITYLHAKTLAINTGSANNTVNVFSTEAAPVTITAGGGSHTFNVGTATNTLDAMLRPLTIHGKGGANVLELNDQGNSTGRGYLLDSKTVNRDFISTIAYDGITSLDLRTGSGDDFVVVIGTSAGTAVSIDGGSGRNALVGPGMTTTWYITALDVGNLVSAALPGSFAFASFGNLIGGADNDTFVFSDGQGVSGIIGGGGAGTTLDYSKYASNNVVVNLRMNQASGVAGGVWNIHKVIGGNTLPGGPSGLFNVLVGDGGNILIGGTGRRNLLIAGPLGRAPSLLIGGNDDDILIGGSTVWDTDPNWRLAFTSVMAEWTRLDLDYFQRVNHIIGGGGLNGSFVLNASTVFNNGGGNLLLGHTLGASNRDLYFDNPGLFDGDDSIPGSDASPVII